MKIKTTICFRQEQKGSGNDSNKFRVWFRNHNPSKSWKGGGGVSCQCTYNFIFTVKQGKIGMLLLQNKRYRNRLRWITCSLGRTTWLRLCSGFWATCEYTLTNNENNVAVLRIRIRVILGSRIRIRIGKKLKKVGSWSGYVPERKVGSGSGSALKWKAGSGTASKWWGSATLQRGILYNRLSIFCQLLIIQKMPSRFL